MSATLFGVMVIHVRPQMERLLLLPSDALMKEIALTQVFHSCKSVSLCVCVHSILSIFHLCFDFSFLKIFLIFRSFSHYSLSIKSPVISSLTKEVSFFLSFSLFFPYSLTVAGVNFLCFRRIFVSFYFIRFEQFC